MTILALEPDPVQAATIRQIVCDVVGAELRIVSSKNDLLRALSTVIPDLILVPALLSQADELELQGYLSTLQGSGHLEMLVTPFLFAPENGPAVVPRGWRQWIGQPRSCPQPYACDRRAFAERLTWSLRHADEMRQKYADGIRRGFRQSDVEDCVIDVPQPEDVLAPYRRGPENRQARGNRFSRGEVPWLSAIKLPWGLEVSLLNISSTGMLVETTSKFDPGTVTELHLCSPDTNLVVPARFVRSEVAAVDARSVRYHAAAVFASELRFPLNFRPGTALSTPKALADLLTRVLTDVDRGGPQGALRAKFERGLLALVSARDIQIRDAVVVPPHGSESIYFAVPSAFDSRAILQVTFEPGYTLQEREFRLLKSAAALAAVVLEFERMPQQHALTLHRGRSDSSPTRMIPSAMAG